MKQKKLGIIFFLLLWTVVVGIGAFHSDDHFSRTIPNYDKISPALLEATESEVQFFITFNDLTYKEEILGDFAFTVITEYTIIPTVLVSGTHSDIERLSTREEVQYLAENTKYHVDQVDVNTSVGGTGMAAGGIGEGYLHGLGYLGSGVVIAVIDTGIDATHPDLDDLDDNAGTTDPKVIGYSNQIAFPNNGWDDPVGDPNGHGTHVAGIISGTGAASTGTYVGVAPQSQLVGVKVLDRYGDGFEGDVINGIQYAVNRGDVDIISLSLGGQSSNPNDPISQAVNVAWSLGFTVVIASGNNGIYGYGTVLSPGMAVSPITVGATDGSSVMWWSSKGFTPDTRIKPDVVAPGYAIISTIPTGSEIANDDPWAIISGIGGDYIALSGTSMATPQVAGGAALLLEAFPAVSNDLLKIVLMEGADDLGEPSENIQGQGQVNLQTTHTLLDTSSYTQLFVTPTTYSQPPHTTTYGTLPPASNSYTLTCIPATVLSNIRIETTGTLGKYLSFSQTTFSSVVGQFEVQAYLDPPDILPYGTHTGTIEFYDSLDTLLGSSSVGMTIFSSADTTPPVIATVQRTPDPFVEYDDLVIIDAAISDLTTGIATAILQYDVDGGGWNDVGMTIYPISTYYSGISGDPVYVLSASADALIPLQLFGSLVTYRVVVTDTYGNTETSTESFYTVGDYTEPTIVGVNRVPIDPGLAEDVTVTATVTEPVGASGIDTVTLSYSLGSGWTDVGMIFVGGDQYDGTILGQSEGTVQYRVSAVDLAGRISTTGIYTYTLPLNVDGYGITPTTQVRTGSINLWVDENDVATSVVATIDGTDYPLTETGTGYWEYDYIIPSDATLGVHNPVITITDPLGTTVLPATFTVDDLGIVSTLWNDPIGQTIQTFTVTFNYVVDCTVFYRPVGTTTWESVTGTGSLFYGLVTPILLKTGTYEFYVRGEISGTGYYVESAVNNFDVTESTFTVAWSITDNIRGAYAGFPVHLVGSLNGYVYDDYTDSNGDVGFTVVGDVYTITLDDGINTVDIVRTVDQSETVEVAVHFTNAPPVVSGLDVSGFVKSYNSIDIQFQVDDYNSLTDVQSITVILNSRYYGVNDPDHPRYHYTATWTWSGGWTIAPQNGGSPVIEDLTTTYDEDAPTMTFVIRIVFPNCDDLSDWDITVQVFDGEVTTTGGTVAYSWVNGNAVLDIMQAIVDSFVELFRYVIGFILPIFGMVIGVSRRHRKNGALTAGGITAIGTLLGLIFNPLIAFATGAASFFLTFGGIGIGSVIRYFKRSPREKYCATNPTAQVCQMLTDVDFSKITVARQHPNSPDRVPRSRKRKRGIL